MDKLFLPDEPTVNEVIEAVEKCIIWCCPELPEVTASTVRHNWRRFLARKEGSL